MTDREARKLLNSLRRLRQACCHPQVGAGGLKGPRQATAPMTMDEVGWGVGGGVYVISTHMRYNCNYINISYFGYYY